MSLKNQDGMLQLFFDVQIKIGYLAAFLLEKGLCINASGVLFSSRHSNFKLCR
jgi:hypothetical protein